MFDSFGGDAHQPQQEHDTCRLADVKGHLLVVKVREYVETIPTVNGEKDAISVDVVDLDDASGQPRIYRAALWFSGRIIRDLKRRIGGTVLGRVQQGEGGSGSVPPWELTDASGNPTDRGRAEAWLTANPDWSAAGAASVASPAGFGIPPF